MTSNNEMQLTGGEGGAHAVLERRARVVIERRPQLISVLSGHLSDYGVRLVAVLAPVFAVFACGPTPGDTPALTPAALSAAERRAVAAAERFVLTNCYTTMPCLPAEQMQPEFLERHLPPESVRSYRQGALKPRALGIRDGTRDGVEPGWTVYFEHTEAFLRTTADLTKEPYPARPTLRGLYISRSFVPLFVEHHDIYPDVPMKRAYPERSTSR